MKAHSSVACQFINADLLTSFSPDTFLSTTPFPWHHFHQFLQPEAFEQLYQDFPSLELFEQHLGIDRGNGQRPHNRYYLAYGESIYRTGQKGQGIITHAELPPIWQAFIEELQTNSDYHAFVRSALGVSQFKIRYAWHVGFSGCEVSPHVDSSDKVGTHILYFNTERDWNPSWGGEILVLGDRQTEVINPEYSDFGSMTPVRITGNSSFFFKNKPHAWHGVQPLNCPEGSYRRLFNIIFEYPQARTILNSSVGKLARKLVPFQSIRSLARGWVLR